MAKQQRAVPQRNARYGPSVPDDWDLVASGGPGRFVTWATYRLPDGSHYTWQARAHRKGAGPRTLRADRVGLRTTADGEPAPAGSIWRQFWAPQRLAWWNAVLFIVGTAFFVVGAAGSLMPSLFGGQNPMSVFAESNYFAGATLFTIGSYGQLLEGLNADDRIDPNRYSPAPTRFRWFITHRSELTRLEILIPLAFLIGSVVFNYETTVALGSVLELMPRIALWDTSLIGSIVFLAAGVLVYLEAGDRWLSVQRRNISWWIGVLFVLGGIGFVIGCLPGVGAPGFPTAKTGSGPTIIKVGFLLGGLAYLVGSYLMLPELFSQLRRRPNSRAAD